MDPRQRHSSAPERHLSVLARATVAVLPVIVTSLLVAAPARAANVFVQVTPSTVEAGNMVNLKASCADNTMPATVDSKAFGTVTLQPQGGQLGATAMVPAQTAPGAYRVRLNCPDSRSAVTMLNVVNAKRPIRGPATGFGGAAGADHTTGLLVGGGLAITAAGAALWLFTLRRRMRVRRAHGG